MVIPRAAGAASGVTEHLGSDVDVKNDTRYRQVSYKKTSRERRILCHTIIVEPQETGTQSALTRAFSHYCHRWVRLVRRDKNANDKQVCAVTLCWVVNFTPSPVVSVADAAALARKATSSHVNPPWESPVLLSPSPPTPLTRATPVTQGFRPRVRC